MADCGHYAFDGRNASKPSWPNKFKVTYLIKALIIRRFINFVEPNNMILTILVIYDLCIYHIIVSLYLFFILYFWIRMCLVYDILLGTVDCKTKTEHMATCAMRPWWCSAEKTRSQWWAFVELAAWKTTSVV